MCDAHLVFINCEITFLMKCSRHSKLEMALCVKCVTTTASKETKLSGWKTWMKGQAGGTDLLLLFFSHVFFYPSHFSDLQLGGSLHECSFSKEITTHICQKAELPGYYARGGGGFCRWGGRIAVRWTITGGLGVTSWNGDKTRLAGRTGLEPAADVLQLHNSTFMCSPPGYRAK